MTEGKARADVSLIDVLIDGFEKNESMGGFHWRDLPMQDADAAAQKFMEFADEAGRWKGPPIRRDETVDRRIAAWPDLEILQAGRGVMVRVRAPWFAAWWHEKSTWEGDPMGPVFDWLREESGSF